MATAASTPAATTPRQSPLKDVIAPSSLVCAASHGPAGWKEQERGQSRRRHLPANSANADLLSMPKFWASPCRSKGQMGSKLARFRWTPHHRGPPSPAGTEWAMTDSDAVLAANLEFYRAFAARDLVAMEELWARRWPVGCVHPGWPALSDRDAVMESWRSILSNPEAPRIACYDERVLLYGETALVLCEEELEGGTLIASNLFVREDGI